MNHPDTPSQAAAARPAASPLTASYWQRTRRLTGGLLLLWFSATFCAIYFARELSTLTVFGWPMSFYLAAQGVSLLFLLILGIYAWRMNQLDAQWRAARAAAEQAREPSA